MNKAWTWRLAKAALVRQKRSRTVLVAAALGATVLVAMLSLTWRMDRRVSQDLRAYGVNMVVSAAREGAGLQEDGLARALAALDPGVRAGAAPYVAGTVSLAWAGQKSSGRESPGLLIGTDLAELAKVKPYLLIEGQWPAQADQVLLGDGLATGLHLDVGDVVLIHTTAGTEQRLTVSGRVISGGEEDEQALVTLPTAQALLGRHGTVDGALLSLVARGTVLDGAGRRLVQVDPELKVEPRAQVSRNETKIQSSMGLFFLLVTGVVVTATLLCLYATMVAMVGERSAEIGLKKALGASSRAVAGEFLRETVMLGLLGGVAGLAAGWELAGAVGRMVLGSALAPPWPVVAATLITTPLVTVGAALVPVRRATGLRPLSLLRGDHV